MDETNWISVLSIASSVASLILAIFAIWLSWLFFRAANKDSRDVSLAIGKIDSATSTLRGLSMKIINRLTGALVETNTRLEHSISSVVSKTDETGMLKAVKESRTTGAATEQFRIDNLITALYYTGVSNIVLQLQLPTTIGETASGASSGAANLVDQSYADFQIMKKWLEGYEVAVKKSPVYNLYMQAMEFDSDVRSVRDYYATLDSDNRQID